jgi:hypothetical protein
VEQKMTAQIVPLPAPNQWRDELLENFSNQLDKLQEMKMTKIEDITKSIFNLKSEMLGDIILGLIKKNYSHLLNQEYCECPLCSKMLKAKNMAVKKTIETANGKTDLYRPYFYCHTCEIGFYPLDEALGLAPSSKQYDVQELEAWLASDMTFDKAGETYQKFTGEKLSADHVHETANKIAKHFDILDVCPSRDEIAVKIEQLSRGKTWRPVMMLAIDGAKEPTRPEPSPWKGKRGKYEYKEAKGFRLYLVDSTKIIHLASWHQIQGDKGDKKLAEDLKTIKEAGLVPEEKVRLCVIGDGADWIWNRVQEIFPTAKQVLDFYHCSEYIHAVAHWQYGEKTKRAREWVEATFTRLFHNDIENVINGMKIMTPKSDNAKEKIDKAVGYLTNHKNRTNYGTAKRAGYHIGSGAIESANKFICHGRLKISGAWWYITNSNNILKLRCAQYNGTFDRIMEKYKQIERERIYGKKTKNKIIEVK